MAAVLLLVGLVGVGCSDDKKAARTPGSVADPSATMVADALDEFPAPAGAEVTVASTTLDIGEDTTFRGTECPAGQRGNLAILPGDGPQVSDQLVFVGGADADEDSRWSVTAAVPPVASGPATIVANCLDVGTGAVRFTYPRVAVTVRG